MKIQSVILVGIFALLGVVTSQEVYCGRRLASALALLCDGNLIKRSEVHHNSIEFDLPWIPSYRAHEMGRNKRQVVSECCDKPCTIDELLSYCGY